MKLTLAQKIFRLSKAAGQIPRNGIDLETGKKYARLEDVLDVVRPLMFRYRLLLTGSTSNCQEASQGVRGTVIYWTLTNLDNPEDQGHYGVPGSGIDNEGHGAALAITASRKAALILIFNLRVADEQLVSEEDAQTQADKIAEKKIAAAQKRKETIAAKEFVTVTWPEAHNGHKALFSGRTHIMETLNAFGCMNAWGNWNDREDGWFVPSKTVKEAVSALRGLGCDVRVEGKL
jgi:hypothetical protein